MRGGFTHEQYRRLCDAIEQKRLGHVANSMCTEEMDSTLCQITLYTGSDEATLEALVREMLSARELTVHVREEDSNAKKAH
jgi:hypothetical protein